MINSNKFWRIFFSAFIREKYTNMYLVFENWNTENYQKIYAQTQHEWGEIYVCSILYLTCQDHKNFSGYKISLTTYFIGQTHGAYNNLMSNNWNRWSMRWYAADISSICDLVMKQKAINRRWFKTESLVRNWVVYYF